MKNQSKILWLTPLMFATFAIVTLMFVASSLVIAQEQQFKVGARVEVKISSTYGWETCTVTENPPQGIMRVKCDAQNGRAAGVFMVYDRRDVRPLKKTEADNRAVTTPTETETKTAPADQQGTYKVGDLVEASPLFKDSAWRPCRVAELTKGNSLKVWCQDYDGQPSGTFSMTTVWVRPRTTKTADDDGAASCSYEAPTGTVANTAPPSAQLFKRVIYDHYNEETVRAIPRPLKVGITFQTFQLGKSYVNRLNGRTLMHDGAPQGATLYPVKTKYIWCRQYKSSVYRYVMETPFVCFKDKFGNWDCPVDGVPKFLEQKDFPIFPQ